MRDFFYSKGDIFLAILIILVAVLVIYLRVGVVMGYDPFGVIEENLAPSSSENPDPEPSPSAVPETDAEDEEMPSDTSEPVETGIEPAGQEQPEEQPAAPPEQTTEPPPAATGTMQITVAPGDAASTIAEKLLKAGAITDKQAFLADVMAQNADSRLKQGTFTIPAGSSHSDIIAILTK